MWLYKFVHNYSIYSHIIADGLGACFVFYTSLWEDTVQGLSLYLYGLWMDQLKLFHVLFSLDADEDISYFMLVLLFIQWTQAKKKRRKHLTCMLTIREKKEEKRKHALYYPNTLFPPPEPTSHCIMIKMISDWFLLSSISIL